MTKIILRDYQREAVDSAFAAWKDGMRSPALVLPTGAGKGHPHDTEIVTPRGLRLWGDLAVGDEVYGSEGTPVRVTGIFERGVLPVFTVGFRDGSEVITDEGHLWQVEDVALRSNGQRKSCVLSTWDMAYAGLRYGHGYRFSLPLAPALKADVPLPADPYAVGFRLGRSARTRYWSYIPDAVLPLMERQSGGRNPVEAADRVLREMGARPGEFEMRTLPRLFLEAGYNQRLRVLRGLVDTRAHIQRGRYPVLWSTYSAVLASDVSELVSSLGGTGGILVRSRFLKGRSRPLYTVRVSTPLGVSPFSDGMDRCRWEPPLTGGPRRAVSSITPSGQMPIRCIQVDAPDSLYQVTRQRILTHNTVVFSDVIRRHVEETGSRAVVLAHRDELVDQAIKKIHDTAPDLSVGKVKAKDDHVQAQVAVCSVQTLGHSSGTRLDRLAASQRQHGDIGLVLTDECHHATAPSYRKIYGALPGARMLGVTATLARGDGRKGLGDIWDEVVFSRSVLWMISKGYLCDVRAQRVEIAALDLGKVKKSRGDFQDKDLGRAMEEAGAHHAIAKAYVEHAPGRPGIVFTPTVATAGAAAKALNEAGIKAEMISGDTPREERMRIFEDFRTGRIQVLVNCAVLTEGFDAPWAEVCVMARPTQSQVLYVQCVGRVLRPWPGKKDALVLDLAGASESNRLATLIDLDPSAVRPKEGESLAEAAVREEEEREAAGVPSLPGVVGVDLKAREANLFEGSRMAWLTTHAGVMFIGCGESTVFLWPAEAGGFTVCTVTGRGGKWQRTEYAALPLSEAMAWGEAVAEDFTGGYAANYISGKNARWRKGKPSQKQAVYARRMGIDPEGLSRGQLSDLLNVRWESHRLDRHVGHVMS